MTGAALSSAARKSLNTRAPCLRPKRLSKAFATSDHASSLPPPRPKIPPTSDAVAIRSSGLNGSGPVGWPVAAYSPGSLVGSSLASAMYRLTPAM